MHPHDPTPGPSPLLSPGLSPTVAADSPCRRCGYSLLGLPVGGLCPECGASIARSLRGNLLRFASPHYLRRLRQGALLVELSVVSLCLAPILGLLLMCLAFLTALSTVERVFPVVGGIFCVTAAVLVVAGWFTLTMPDPAHVGFDVANRSRLITRIATAACAAAWSAGAVVSALPTVAAVAPVSFAALLQLNTAAVVGTAWTQVIVSMTYLGHVAVRVPDPKLKKEIHAARRVAMGAAALSAAALSLSFSRWLGCPMTAVSLMAAVVALTFMVRYADLIDRLRRRLVELRNAQAAEF